MIVLQLTSGNGLKSAAQLSEKKVATTYESVHNMHVVVHDWKCICLHKKTEIDPGDVCPFTHLS